MRKGTIQKIEEEINEKRKMPKDYNGHTETVALS